MTGFKYILSFTLLNKKYSLCSKQIKYSKKWSQNIVSASNVQEDKKYNLYLAKTSLMDERNLELNRSGKIIKEKPNIPKKKLNLGFIKKRYWKEVFLDYKFLQFCLLPFSFLSFFKLVQNKNWHQKKNLVFFSEIIKKI